MGLSLCVLVRNHSLITRHHNGWAGFLLDYLRSRSAATVPGDDENYP